MPELVGIGRIPLRPYSLKLQITLNLGHVPDPTAKNRLIYSGLMLLCLVGFWWFENFYTEDPYPSPPGSATAPAFREAWLPSGANGERIRHDHYLLEYAESSKLYLPVENIELLSRYGHDEGLLDKLGGGAWQSKKAKLKERIREMADRLIRIAAVPSPCSPYRCERSCSPTRESWST